MEPEVTCFGKETAEQYEKRIVGSWNRKSRVFEWETAEQCENRIAGSCNRKSRVLEWETAGECEKTIVGSRWVKTAEKTRAQSPKSNFGNVGRYKRVNPKVRE